MNNNSKLKIPYNPIITHDIDRFYKWKKIKSIFGESGRILRQKSTWSLKEAWSSYLSRQQRDPFSNLSMIAELDNKAGLQSVFYIMTTLEKHPKNINDYNVKDRNVLESLRQVVSTGSEIGLHPGIFTFNNQKQMQEQKLILEEAIQQDVVRSRQHYLKYEYPITFKILESIGIKNDSSILVDLEVEENIKKRSTYTMTDDDSRKKMNITQTPLVFMDTHLMQYGDDVVLNNLEKSISSAKRDGGEIMILWHNNNISNNREIGLYKEALEVIKAE